MERLADALPVERAASRWIVSTDPDEQVEQIRPYVDLGFCHLVFHAPGPDQARFLKLYAERVLPRLRASSADDPRGQTRGARPASRWSSRATISAPSSSPRSRQTGWRRPTAMSWWWRRRSCRRRRAAMSISPAVTPSAAARRSPSRSTRIRAWSRSSLRNRGASCAAARCSDRRASARLRHGQCGRRPIQCRDRMRRRAGAAAAARPRRHRRARCARLWSRHFGERLAVIVSDSFGRPWRRGTVGIALGAAGMPALVDLRGKPDLLRAPAAGHRDRLCR